MKNIALTKFIPIKLSKPLLIGLGLLASAPSVLAQEYTDADYRGWFVGGGIGTAEFDNEWNVDESSFSHTILWGYRFGKHFSVQGNISDLGDFDDIDDSGEYVSMSSATFSAVGIVPLGNSGVDLFARLGLGVISLTENYDPDEDDFWDDYWDDISTGEVKLAAVGLHYTPKITHGVTFFVAYDSYYFDVKGELESSNIRTTKNVGVTNIGLQYSF